MMTNDQIRGDVDEALAELGPLVEVSHATHEEIRAFREKYERLGENAPLPPKSLREMREGRRRYLNLLDRLAGIAKRFAPLIDALEIDPLVRLHGLGTSLAAAVTLYDDYLSLLTLLKDDRLRRLLNHPDFGYGIEEGVFWKIVDGLNSEGAHALLNRLLDAWSLAEAQLKPTDGRSTRIRRAIESSVSFRYAQAASLREHLPTEWKVRRTKFMDALEGIGGDTVGAISKAFGNGIGLVEMRKGKLWNDDGVRRHLLETLQPLDLLLEKTPFRLTDFFIPGHFGHVAIWMGDARELDTLGLWDLAAMENEPLCGCRELIGSGHSVLEALRPGVQLNRLGDFLNVDDVAILRPTNLVGEQVVESLVRGFGQIGKEYDFNFDVETTGTIVCSELPYHVYPDVDWSTDAQLGRFTINPDHVAAQALSRAGAFELKVLYQDGCLVDPGEALASMTSLIQA
jgi:hypothetical protein